MRLEPGVVAVVQASSCSSHSTPSLGTSIGCRFGPKKEKRKEEKKENQAALLSKRITSSDAAGLVSLFHDIGKVNPNFQQKLNGSCP